MKRIGIITKYNGNYGTIINSQKEVVDFSKKDLFNKNIVVGNKVEFRQEEKELNLKIARNIKIIVDDNSRN